jgi:hypothetical protein
MGVEVERAHRTGKPSNRKPRSIVMKLLNFKDKQRILRECRKLKDTNIFVYEYFSKDSVALRRTLMQEVKRLRNENQNVGLRYDRIIYYDRKRNNHNE